MEIEKIYLIVTELNGYKNFAGAFRDKEEALKVAEETSLKWEYQKHQFFVVETSLF